MSELTSSTLRFWNDEFWSQGLYPWHSKKPNEHLLLNKERFLGRDKVRVLVPLCGKTVDLKWLYEQGHEVVGVEGITEAIEQFFADTEIEYTVSGDGKSYQTLDKRLTILHQDFFTLAGNYTNYFDCVWDRASMVALRPEDRDVYIETIKRLVKNTFKYLLVTVEYDDSKVAGPPPFSIPPDKVQQLCQGWATMEQLDFVEEKPGDGPPSKYSEAGVSRIERAILLSSCKLI
ncbi:Thiopurine S-methyltransferase [Halotydeus destructor]|nr:Thiopurine S-methyltransferase [Halotydeus destructor]